MTKLSDLFDSYGLRARLYPALLTLLPVLAVVASWLPALPKTAATTVLAVASASGVFYALASYARTAGKRVEKRLLAQWGCWPTTAMLRHRDPRVSVATTARYHAYLAAGAGVMPTPEAEQASPADADELYSSAVQWLKEQRRGTDFSLIHAENAEYGFRRNLRGLKGVALFALGASLFFWIGALIRASGGWVALSIQPLSTTANLIPVAAWGSLAIVLTAILAWHSVVRDRWVTEAAEHYATALLASCDAPKAATPKPDGA